MNIERSVRNLINGNGFAANKLYLAMTGGGTCCLPWLLENGGASKFFLGAQIPYTKDELKSCIRKLHLDKCVTEEVAIGLSLAGPLTEPHIGIGVTASLRKAEEREDRQHHFFLAVSSKCGWDRKLLYSCEVVLGEDRTRKEEEELLGRSIIAMAECYCLMTMAHPFKHEPWVKEIGLTDNDKISRIRFHENIEDLESEFSCS